MTFAPGRLSSSTLAALIITYNEESNIKRTLSSLQWLPEILIVDSGSTDSTLEIARMFKNTRIVYRAFDTFAHQCNFGLSQLSSEWVLSLDADYVLSKQLSEEILEFFTNQAFYPPDCQAYRISFYYCIHGKPLRSGLLPPRTCLYERKNGYYIDEGHGHRVIISGKTSHLKNRIFHDDRKPFNKWLDNQRRYQKIEADMLKVKHYRNLPIQDLIRKYTFLAPFSAFFMCLVLRGGLLEGKAGMVYAFYRLVAEGLLYLYMHADDQP